VNTARVSFFRFQVGWWRLQNSPMKNNDSSFFAEPIDHEKEARDKIITVVCRLFLWITDAPTLADRGLRASVVLYCVRPDLIDGITLEEIGDQAGYTRQLVHQLVRRFRRHSGFES